MTPLSNKQKIVISASRRTDIPAFYMEWFMRQIDLGHFEVVNPFNQRKSYIPATPEKVHTIVFWSKNFDLFINKGYGEKLKKSGFNLFFNFTINSPDTLLEPNLPDLKNRLNQIKELAERFGNRTIQWRFDPVCHYINKGTASQPLSEFDYIAGLIAESGIRTCITSFVDLYEKVKKRCSTLSGFKFTDPTVKDKVEILAKMEAVSTQLNLDLKLCCEKEIIAALPVTSTISRGSCIDNLLLKNLFGGKISLAKDAGQRTKMGCDCKKSYDIGSYSSQPCSHNCLYCYANPQPSIKKDQ